MRTESRRFGAALAAALLCAALCADIAAAKQSSAALAADGSEVFNHAGSFTVALNSPGFFDPTSAEIADVSADGETMIYTDSLASRLGFVGISDPAAPQPAGTLPIDGEPASIAVLRELALVAVDTSESFTDPSGELLVVDVADARRAHADRARGSAGLGRRLARPALCRHRDREPARRGFRERRLIPQLPGGVAAGPAPQAARPELARLRDGRPDRPCGHRTRGPRG